MCKQWKKQEKYIPRSAPYLRLYTHLFTEGERARDTATYTNTRIYATTISHGPFSCEPSVQERNLSMKTECKKIKRERFLSSSVGRTTRNSLIVFVALPTLISAMRARFFTRPTACPSGVSAGQIIPQCVL